MSSLVYTNNNNNNNNNLKIEMTGNGAAHLFPIVGINSATKMYRYQNIVPAPTVAATAQTAATTTTSATSGCGKIRKYSARSGDNTTNGISSSSSNNTNASLAANSAPYNIDQSQSVQRRNARERNRVKQVNNSFARLRQHIPQSIIADLTKGGGRGPQKKISKVDTLRIAVEYIRRLQDLVEDLNGSAAANNGGATNNVASFSAAAAALLPSSATLSNNNLAATTTTANNFCNNNNLASTPPPINSTSPLPLMLSNTSSPHHNSINNGNISIAISALQQQQQLTRQQYPNHPLTPISLNAYSPPPAALSTQTQLDQHVGCHSPTSSFNSSMSFDSGTFEAAPQQLSPLAANTPQQQQQQQQQQQHQQQHLPTSVLELPLSQHIAINQTQLNEHHAHLQLKFEPHEHFNLDEEDCTPDDEEILDYISLWQEQ